MGIADYGVELSCCRDEPFATGLNSKLKLKRKQTLMEGAEYCDFRYYLNLAFQRVGHLRYRSGKHHMLGFIFIYQAVIGMADTVPVPFFQTHGINKSVGFNHSEICKRCAAINSDNRSSLRFVHRSLCLSELWCNFFA